MKIVKSNFEMSAPQLKVTALECIAQNDICSLRIICNLAQNNEYNLEEVDVYGNTALLKACYLDRHEAVGILLEFNANIRATNFFGQNALTLAAYSGSIRTIRKLLRYRSYTDFNLASITPALCIAIMRQDRRLIDYFRNIDRHQSRTEDVSTVHGLTPQDMERFVRCKQNGQRKTKPLLL